MRESSTSERQRSTSEQNQSSHGQEADSPGLSPARLYPQTAESTARGGRRGVQAQGPCGRCPPPAYDRSLCLQCVCGVRMPHAMGHVQRTGLSRCQGNGKVEAGPVSRWGWGPRLGQRRRSAGWGRRWGWGLGQTTGTRTGRVPRLGRDENGALRSFC